MDDPRTPVSNMPEYTVSEISGAVKRTLETTFGRIRVRGEVTELKRYPSGHVYLSLKDESAKISGIIWRNSVSRLGMTPENGVEVIATGRISSYPERSSYQLIIERMEYAGAGALLARIEMLRVRLAAEGLFDAARKKPLPGLPQVIGVVSSERGAVIQDILTTIARRFPRTILLWPVPVQGEGAAERIAAAIEGFDALPVGGPVPRPDVLIVARGGGSLEDLMAFNEEIVVRAAAESEIPLISAVGHETDTTLIDFASDLRAPTPTAAAEKAVPVRAELIATMADMGARMIGAMQRGLEERRNRLGHTFRALPHPRRVMEDCARRLDERVERLTNAPRLLLERRRAELDRLAARLRHPREQLAEAGHRLAALSTRLDHAMKTVSAAERAANERRALQLEQSAGRLIQAMPRLLDEKAKRIAHAGQLLESFSYRKVLERGFAVVRDEHGTPVTSVEATKPGAMLAVEFADGKAGVRVEGSAAPPAPKAAKKPAAPDGRQGSLL